MFGLRLAEDMAIAGAMGAVAGGMERRAMRREFEREQMMRPRETIIIEQPMGYMPVAGAVAVAPAAGVVYAQPAPVVYAQPAPVAVQQQPAQQQAYVPQQQAQAPQQAYVYEWVPVQPPQYSLSPAFQGQQPAPGMRSQDGRPLYQILHQVAVPARQ